MRLLPIRARAWYSLKTASYAMVCRAAGPSLPRYLSFVILFGTVTSHATNPPFLRAG